LSSRIFPDPASGNPQADGSGRERTHVEFPKAGSKPIAMDLIAKMAGSSVD
jgi:hypothetical protein